MPLATDATADPKKDLRAACLARRRAIPEETQRQAAHEAARIFLEAIGLPDSATVSGYWPIRGELDPRPLMIDLDRRRHRLFLPSVEDDGPLKFRAWHEGEALAAGPIGTQEPLAEAPEGTPDIVIVPLLAFDADGYRLGYGKGFYDLTLAEQRRNNPGVVAVGFAFESQRTDSLPRDDWDQPLDWIVTERRARRIQ